MHEHDWLPAPELNSYQTSRYRCACGAVGRRVTGVIRPYSASHKFVARQPGQQFMALGIAATESAQACRRESDEPPVPPMHWKAHL